MYEGRKNEAKLRPRVCDIWSLDLLTFISPGAGPRLEYQETLVYSVVYFRYTPKEMFPSHYCPWLGACSRDMQDYKVIRCRGLLSMLLGSMGSIVTGKG